MINLLPENSKKELRAARMNVVLVRYTILTISAVGFLLVAQVGFYAYLASTKANAEAANTDNQTKAAAYDSVKKEAAEYRKNLSIAKQIFGNQINYTSLVFGITELLPQGVILDSLNISGKDLGSQTTLTAHAKSYDAATQLKQNFEQSKLFENVYFQSLNAAEGTNTAYPIDISISVKLKKETK